MTDIEWSIQVVPWDKLQYDRPVHRWDGCCDREAAHAWDTAKACITLPAYGSPIDGSFLKFLYVSIIRLLLPQMLRLAVTGRCKQHGYDPAKYDAWQAEQDAELERAGYRKVDSVNRYGSSD